MPCLATRRGGASGWWRPQSSSLAGNRLQGVLVRAMEIGAATQVAVRDAARDPAAGPDRRWWQQRLDTLPQLVGQESIHQGAHGREHPRPA